MTLLDSPTATCEVQVLVPHKFTISARSKFHFLIYADQCPSMAKAIPQSFPNTVHKLCHWHILKKFKEYLALVYKKYKTFKEEFTTILNWLLMPTELRPRLHSCRSTTCRTTRWWCRCGVIGNYGYQHIIRTFYVLEWLLHDEVKVWITCLRKGLSRGPRTYTSLLGR